MRIAIKGVLFHFSMIILFSFIYVYFSKHFSKSTHEHPHRIDLIVLATTIEAGVGYSNVHPFTDLGKALLIVQQLIMISTNVFLLYIFTL